MFDDDRNYSGVKPPASTAGLSPGRLRGGAASAVENAGEKPRKAGLEVGPAERDEPLRTLNARLCDARVAEHLEMMAERGLGHPSLKPAAGHLPGAVVELAHDLEAQGIAQGVEDVRQLELATEGLWDGSHISSIYVEQA